MATSLAAQKPTEQQSLVSVTELLGNAKIDSSTSSDIVDTVTALSYVLDAVEKLSTEQPCLYIDLEGESLSRDGTISILQLYLAPADRTYLIDIFTLGSKSFTTGGKNGRTLQEILEDPKIPKVFFDVRNDSDALYSHYKIRLAGVQDLQLMELATRGFGRRLVNGLARCIEREGGLSAVESREWRQSKDKGKLLFAPECGGSYSVFNDRPLSEEISRYCIQDVQFLPRLWRAYDRKLTPKWRQRVTEGSMDRVVESQSKTYMPHGKHKALGPASWNYVRD